MPDEKNPDDGAPRPDGDQPAAPRPEDAFPDGGPPPAQPAPDAGVEELTALVDALADPAAAELPAPEDTLADLPPSLPEEEDAAPDPEDAVDERAARFRATEAEVRDLRQRKRDGLITQEQLLDELRRHMIEDEGVWWMLGVETDTWYRYDELAGGWVIASPPAHAGVSPGGDIDLPEGLAGPQETLSATLPPGFALDEDELPRADTPLYDEEATIPGMAAIHQATQRLSQESAPRPADPGVTSPAQQLRERLAPRAEVPPPRPASPPPVANPLPQRLLLLAALLGGAFLALVALTGLVILLRYNSIVGNYSEAIEALAQAQPAFQSLRILDGSGELLAELDSEDGRREPRALGDISPWLIAAVIAAQEPLFYGSSDFNLPRIAGDLFGSAPDASATIARRLTELSIRNEGVGAAAQLRHRNVVAAELARRYDRNTLLERYLNEAEFGPRVFGAQAAAQFWFGLDAGQLQPVESALLASFLTHPGVTPLEAATRAEAFANADALLRRLAATPCLYMQHASAHADFAAPFCAHRRQILDERGDFSPAINLQRATLGARDFSAPGAEAIWPRFSAQVVAELRAGYGEDAFRSGATVHTTLDPRIQQAAADALRDQLQVSGLSRNVQTGAVSVVDPASGELLALVGGEGDPQAIPGFQAPDAALMPLLYAAALEGVGDRNGNGQLDHDEYLTAASILWDVPGQAPNPFFPPLPHGNQTRGPVSLRSALANALNIPAARVWDFVTRDRFLETAARLGLKTFQTAAGDGLGNSPGETGVLLPELMQAYGTLANYGRYQPLSAIRAVTLADGSEVPRLDAPESGDVLHPGVALLIGNLMAEDGGRGIIGEGGPLTLPGHEGAIAAVANTTLGSRDLWAMGYSNNLVVGVWLGRHDDQPTASSGLLEAAPVFRRVMQAALQGRPSPTRFSGAQATLAMAPVCRLSGALPDAACPGGQGQELFVPGYPPPPPEQGAIVSRTIDTWSGLLANEFCPQFHREQTLLRLEAEDPLVTAWLGSAAGQNFLSASGLSDLPVGAAPTSACDVSTRQPTLVLLNPPHNSVVQGSITVTGTVAAQNMERFELSLVTTRGALIQQLGSWDRQRPGQGESLVQWNTAAVPDGQYLLRLTARSVGGGYAQREAFVVISNAVPAGG